MFEATRPISTRPRSDAMMMRPRPRPRPDITRPRPNNSPGMLTGRLHSTIVGPTSRSDWSVRLVGPTIVSCKRFFRPVGQTVRCLISSDCRSDCRTVWTIRPTGRTDRPVGRPITLQCMRYLLLTSLLHSCSCHIHEWWLIS